MLAILHSVGMFVADLFKSRCRLEAENLFLRHQLSIALRRAPPPSTARRQPGAAGMDPALAELARCGQGRSAGDDPSVASLRVQSLLALEIPKAGRAPEDDRGLRDLIRRMSKENQQWGASRIHGELLTWTSRAGQRRNPLDAGLRTRQC